MNTSSERELLSVLLDGEASELELRRCLRDLDADGLAQLSRWQLSRDVLAGHPVAAVPSGFAARLQQALGEQESAAPVRADWFGAARRAVVAAGVAAATVAVGWQFWDAGSVPGAPAVAVSGAAPVQSPMDTVSNPASRGMPSLLGEVSRTTLMPGSASLVSLPLSDLPSVQAAPAAATPVSPLLIRHSEMAARHSGQGLTPYVRLLGAEGHGAAE